MEHYNHLTFKDDRGSYTPISTTVLGDKWDQCSISINNEPYTFRGLHYQDNPRQTKYVKVVQGSIVDFMVDLNTKEVEYLIMKDTDAVRIPNNKAHGFLTLEPNTIVVYLVEGDYSPESEHSIPWNTISEIEKVVLAHSAYNEIITSDKDKIGK